MVEGSVRGLLQMMFGAGMMIALRHTLSADGPVGALDSYMRRNMWLIVFGALHAVVLMWPGDILFIYGLTALLLPPFRLMRPKTQFLPGAGLVLAIAIGPGIGSYFDRADKVSAVQAAAAKQAAHKPLTAGDKKAIEDWKTLVNDKSWPATGAKAKAMAEEMKARRGGQAGYWQFAVESWTKFLFELGEIWQGPLESFGPMLIGAALLSWGVMQGKRSTRFYWRLMLGCYAVGFAARAVSLDTTLVFATPRTGLGYRTFVFTLDQLVRIPIAIGHIGLIALMLRSRVGLLAGAARVIAANGRLPLSTYFSASILTMWIIMPGFALNQWGRYSAAGQAGIVAAIILAQVIAANLWLRDYVNGPAEWLWKSLAYWKRQPFRRAMEGEMPVGRWRRSSRSAGLADRFLERGDAHAPFAHRHGVVCGLAVGREVEPLLGSEAVFHREDDVERVAVHRCRDRPARVRQRALPAPGRGLAQVPFAHGGFGPRALDRLREDQCAIRREVPLPVDVDRAAAAHCDVQIAGAFGMPGEEGGGIEDGGGSGEIGARRSGDAGGKREGGEDGVQLHHGRTAGRARRMRRIGRGRRLRHCNTRASRPPSTWPPGSGVQCRVGNIEAVEFRCRVRAA